MTIFLAGLFAIGVIDALPPAVPPGAGFWLGISVGVSAWSTGRYVVLPLVLRARLRKVAQREP